MMNPNLDLLTVTGRHDVPDAYRDTAIADLIAYHNADSPRQRYEQPKLLAGMCMDYRKRIRIPANFACVMRAGGANLQGLEFQMSVATAVGGVRAIAIVGHDRCAMSGLPEHRDAFVSGLVEGAGWDRKAAERHFDDHAPRFEIGDPVEYTRAQARSLREQYREWTVAPLFYRLDDGLLYLITEGEEARS